MFEPELYLDRIAAKLRSEIGPAITDDYARTQAFMASVILERVSRQISHGALDDSAELAALRSDLEPQLAGHADLEAALAGATDTAGLCTLIEALHGAGDRLGDNFDPIIGRVRTMLRVGLDRDLLIAEGKAS